MSQKIKFNELIDTIARDTGLEHDLVKQFIQEFGSIVETGLKRDGKVRIHEFGTFSLHWMKPRSAKNPRMGDPVEVPGQHRILFHPAKTLREVVNRRYAHLKATILDEPRRPVAIEDDTTREHPNAGLVPDAISGEADTVEDSFYAASNPGQTSPEPISTNPADARSVRIPTRAPSGRRSNRKRATRNRKESRPVNRGLVFLSFLFLFLATLVVFVYLQKFNHLMPINMESMERLIGKKAAHQPADALTDASQTEAADGPETLRGAATESTKHNYQISPGDNLWRLAARHYQQPYMWPYIYQANQALVSHPDSLEVGTRLSIPDLKGGLNRATAQQKHEAAKGYFDVYLAYKKQGRMNAFYFLHQAARLDSALISARSFQIPLADRMHLNQLKRAGIKQAGYAGRR